MNWTPCSLCLQVSQPRWGLPTCPNTERKSSVRVLQSCLGAPREGSPQTPLELGFSNSCVVPSMDECWWNPVTGRWVMQRAQNHKNTRNAKKSPWGVPAPWPGQLGPASGTWHSLRDKRAPRPGMATAAGGTHCWQTNRKQALSLGKSKRESRLPIFSTR